MYNYYNYYSQKFSTGEKFRYLFSLAESNPTNVSASVFNNFIKIIIRYVTFIT